MNPLIESNTIREVCCGENFSYVLADNTNFMLTEYKVLQSQGNDVYIKCMKMLFNGNVQLYYLTNGFKSFQELISAIDSSNLLKIISNILHNVIGVKNNGFLSCQNLNISLDRIYVDTSNLQVRLIYLPLNKHSYDSYASFENELRTSLVKLINNYSGAKSERLAQFALDLSDGSLSIENLFSKIKGLKPSIQSIVEPGHSEKKENNELSNSSNFRIVAMNAPSRLEICVTKDEFILGRSTTAADGAITYNKAIGRTHCKITKTGEKYCVTDLSSANGTYVNKVRLVPNRPCELKNNDILRLANSDFQVCIV